jgi:hypothetical protein
MRKSDPLLDQGIFRLVKPIPVKTTSNEYFYNNLLSAIILNDNLMAETKFLIELLQEKPLAYSKVSTFYNNR